MLTSQGWTPGDYLGAPDAAHAAHYTAANASHIRVFLKDDTLGLGARRGKEAAERFGLGGFEGVLGRLNGKEEVVLKKEEEEREVMEMRVYENMRWGTMRFVSGGFLVGDKIERLVEGEKKRKREDEGEEDEREEPERKLRRKKGKTDIAAEAVEEESESLSSKSKDKKDKKRRKQKDADETTSESITSTDAKSEKKRRKAEKRALKEAKRQNKALRKAAKSGSKTTSTTSTAVPSRAESESLSEEEEDEVQKPAVATPNPAFSMVGGRHAVRQRYIRQKKMASMDPRAMREVCI
jgi:Pin2-interacting protein X1